MLRDVSPDSLPDKFVTDYFRSGLLPFVRELCVVTGVAGNGKSTYIQGALQASGVDQSAALCVHEHPVYRYWRRC